MISAQLVTEQTREIHPDQNQGQFHKFSINNRVKCPSRTGQPEGTVPLGEAAFLLRQAAEEVVGPGDMHRVLLDLQQPHQQRDQIGATVCSGH
jgi:hypothetical protein